MNTELNIFGILSTKQRSLPFEKKNNVWTCSTEVSAKPASLDVSFRSPLTSYIFHCT